MFGIGALLPVLNWASFGLIEHFQIPARALTGSWLIAGLALAFALGAATSLRQLFRGLAVGLSISSLVAIAQAFGYGPEYYGHPAGLLHNPAIQACAIALTMLALFCHGDINYVPAMLPGLLLAQSRGGYLVLAIGVVAAFNWRAALLALSVAFLAATLMMGASDIDRLTIWSIAWQQLDWFGHGAGSFANLLYRVGDSLHYPGHVHNDYLQLAYEFGIMAIPAYLLYAMALARTESRYWPVFAGFATAGAFFFPLYAPVTGFIGAVAAGHILYGGRRAAVVVPRRAF